MRKHILMILIVAIISMLLIACSSDSSSSGGNDDAGKKKNGEKTTIQFWHALGGKNGELIDEMLKRFNDSQDEIEVVGSFQGGYDEAVTKLQQSISADTSPDIAMIERAYVEMFADSEVLEDLTPYFESSDLNVDDFTEGLMGHSYFNDQLLSLPFNRSTPILHVNKSMLDENGLEVPTTWEELKEVANALVIKEGDEYKRYGFSMPYDTWYPIAMITQSGGTFFNEDNTSVGFFDNGVGEEVFSFLKDVQSTGAMYYPPAQDSGNIVNQMFMSENIGIMYQSTGTIGTLMENVEFDYVTTFLPKNDEYAAPTGGGNIAMLAGSENKEAAWKFIEWMLKEPEGLLQFVIDSGYLPFTNTMVESQEMKELWAKEPNRQVAYEQLEHAVDTNKDVEWPVIMHEFFSAIEAIMYNDEEIKPTLKKFKEETERILNK
ncbi:ABC transporter substrate-binding protein [Siminovitchia sp. FSL W7-1587]|uniref:ABC transporter substrate-binding protein n=1 Tax=Siminovitchia sp. FSL W7-1587 TaxID=2954699 RepID=UPI0030CF2CC7